MKRPGRGANAIRAQEVSNSMSEVYHKSAREAELERALQRIWFLSTRSAAGPFEVSLRAGMIAAKACRTEADASRWRAWELMEERWPSCPLDKAPPERAIEAEEQRFDAEGEKYQPAAGCFDAARNRLDDALRRLVDEAESMEDIDD